MVVEQLWINKLRFENAGEVIFYADKGSEWCNDYADAVSKLYGFKFEFISERNSQNNGMVERFMQTWIDHFKKAMCGGVMDKMEWGLWGYQLASVYNATYHEELQNSPHFVGNVRELILPTMNSFVTGGKTTKMGDKALYKQAKANRKDKK